MTAAVMAADASYDPGKFQQKSISFIIKNTDVPILLSQSKSDIKTFIREMY